MSVKRDTILTAVQTRLAGITTAGGYHSTLTGRVAIWQPTPMNTWGVVILPTREDVVDILVGDFWNRRLTLQILVQADGSTSETTVSQIIEDIYKAIGTGIQWSGNALNTNPVGFEMEVDQNEKRIAGATITIEIDYRTGAWAES